MGDMQKEIQNLWREMVSEMNYALSDDCLKELQAQNLLEVRYHKLRLSLQGAIDAIKEFTEAEQPLPPNPFDVENLPQIPSNELIPPMNHQNFPRQPEDSTFFSQKNFSISLASINDNFDSGNRNHNSDGSSINNPPNTIVTSRSNISVEETQFHNPFKCNNNRKPEKVLHALQIPGNKHGVRINKYQSYLPESSASSVVSVHTLTYASLSPPAEPENNNDRNFKKRSDDSDLHRSSTVSQYSEQFQERTKMVFNGKNFLSNKAGVVIYPSESLEQRHSVIVVPSPDLSCTSSDDEEEVEQKRFSNITNNHREMKSVSAIKPDPSSIYAKRSDLIPHKPPPSKQLINVKVTWIASQRDFYVTLMNEQRKYNLLVQDIYEQNYESLIGRKVEEGEPCMVYKNGQFYRALLESSMQNMCHVFLVDFGGYLMISKREIMPMLQQHTQLPMAAIHCAILGAFQVRLKAETIDAFKKMFPIDSTFKLLFVHKSKYDDIYETQLYLRENMRHDAFLPLEAYCN